MEFKGYTKFRIPQATVCSEQSTHIGGLQPGAQASVKAGKIALLLYLSQACQQETTWKRQQQK